MNKHEWNTLQWFQYKAIHCLYDLLVFFQESLLEWACERDLWRRPEDREIEQEIDDQ